ncbi:MAG: octaprenyl diphosphate synthase [Thiohalomonadaceae bacterium]
MKLQDVLNLIADDKQALDQLIQQRLSSNVVLIDQISHYIINSGGKRLRPLLVLLVARALGYQGTQHIDLAVVVEFIHTATLLHDDVVDASDLRRGQQSANAMFGDEASVLVGDFLYTRAFQMMVGVGSMQIMQILSDATNTIAEGEVLQLLNCHDPDTTEERYMDVIHYKTAKLFEAACQLSAVLAGRPAAEEQAMARYGMYLGTAFQMIDDVLDYSATSENLGKNVGDDLAEGKPTLPLIHAMRHGTAEQTQLIRNTIETGGRENMAEISAAIESTGAITYTARLARQEAERALAELVNLPNSPYKQALVALAEFSVDRAY